MVLEKVECQYKMYKVDHRELRILRDSGSNVKLFQLKNHEERSLTICTTVNCDTRIVQQFQYSRNILEVEAVLRNIINAREIDLCNSLLACAFFISMNTI